MSIIHDALKKVQKDLKPKTNEPPAPQSGTTLKGAPYLYATPDPAETKPPVNTKTADKKPTSKNGIKTLFTLILTGVITAGAIWFIYLQFKNDLSNVQKSVKKSFYKLMHKENLKPLGQITIPPQTIPASNTAQPTAPITLKIHGIMSDPMGNLALINDRVYQEGDEVDGAKIVKINLNSITVNINGTEKTISVK